MRRDRKKNRNTYERKKKTGKREKRKKGRQAVMGIIPQACRAVAMVFKAT